MFQVRYVVLEEDRTASFSRIGPVQVRFCTLETELAPRYEHYIPPYRIQHKTKIFNKLNTNSCYTLI